MIKIHKKLQKVAILFSILLIISNSATAADYDQLLIDIETKISKKTEAYRTQALSRIKSFSAKGIEQKYTITYIEGDLQKIVDYIKNEADVTVNVSFDKIIDFNNNFNLAQAISQSDHYKNIWEVGQSHSGASNETMMRRLVEKEMGYTDKKYDYDNPGFVPADLPKYGALNVGNLTQGGAGGYGRSYLVLKDEVKLRCSYLPGDSFGLTSGVFRHLTTVKYILPLIAEGHEPLIRLAAMIAGGKDKRAILELQKTLLISRRLAEKAAYEEIYAIDKLTRKKKKLITAYSRDFANNSADRTYLEAEIHGMVAWKDVKAVIINAEEVNFHDIFRIFVEARRKYNANFKVSIVDPKKMIEFKEKLYAAQ